VADAREPRYRFGISQRLGARFGQNVKHRPGATGTRLTNSESGFPQSITLWGGL
jgi:hypothetical protein